MYGGYTASSVLQEYSLTFFTLLNEGYRQRNEDSLVLSNITLLPHMEDKDRRRYLNSLNMASKDVNDILSPRGEGSTTGQLKRLFG